MTDRQNVQHSIAVPESWAKLKQTTRLFYFFLFCPSPKNDPLDLRDSVTTDRLVNESNESINDLAAMHGARHNGHLGASPPAVTAPQSK